MRWFWICILVIFLSFWLLGAKRLDPDFGWHYQAGRYMLKHADVPRTDPFSYTMPSFQFVDHEWLTNVGLAYGYDKIGFVGLGFLFALMVIVSLLLVFPLQLRKWAILPLLLLVPVWFGRGGVRPQVISWFFVSLFLYVFRNVQLWKRWRWLVPVVFCLWANLHGGFFIGICIFGFVLAWRDVQQRRISLTDWLTFFFSVGATLINPYSTQLWYEVWMQLSDTELRSRIVEWMPFYYSVEFGPLFGAVIVGSFGWRFRKMFPWWEWGLLIVTFLAGLSSLRHMAFFALVAMPILATSLKRFSEYAQAGRLSMTALSTAALVEVKRRLWIFFGILLGLTVALFVLEVGWTLYREVTEPFGGKFYPTGAVMYLQTHRLNGQLFSDYGWGGYLIWKLPEQKVFIDGRMPSWRYDVPFFGYKKEVPNESVFAMEEHMKVVDEGAWQDIFEKYNIKTVLWHKTGFKEESKNRFGSIVKSWIEQLDLLLGKTRKEDKKFFIEQLEGFGWKQVYSDEIAEIWER